MSTRRCIAETASIVCREVEGRFQVALREQLVLAREIHRICTGTHVAGEEPYGVGDPFAYEDAANHAGDRDDCGSGRDERCCTGTHERSYGASQEASPQGVDPDLGEPPPTAPTGSKSDESLELRDQIHRAEARQRGERSEEHHGYLELLVREGAEQKADDRTDGAQQEHPGPTPMNLVRRFLPEGLEEGGEPEPRPQQAP